jgi:hypothetical protein
MSTRRPAIACALVLAGAFLPACSNDDPGIVVNIDLAGFKPESMRVYLDAAPKGFVAQPEGGNVQNIGITTEDIDGNGTLELDMQFTQPRGSLSFRVATANDDALSVNGHAIAFDATKVIAGADTAKPIQVPAGARETLTLTLVDKPGDVIGPMTRTTDILTAPANAKVTTTKPAHFASVAVCDVDGDKKDDLILGAPQANNMNLNAAGAVYVLLGAGGIAGDIDLENGNTVTEFHFLGENSGDQLGATVACADLDGDDVGDLIVAAPGARRVYAVFGNGDIRTQAIDPGGTGASAPDVIWTSADASFGSLLFAADLDGDKNAELMVASPSAKKVHLLKNVTSRTTTPIDVDGADHIVFSNVSATAIAAGNLRHVTGGVDVVIGDSSGMRPNVTMGGGAIFGFADVKLDTTTQYDMPSTVIYGGDNMLFGAALLVLATTTAGPDLIVGAPGADNAAGAVYLYEGDNNFFAVTERSIDDHPVRLAGPVPGGRFGASLAGTPSGKAPNYTRRDLIVGAPDTRHNDNRPLAGAAYLFLGGDGWLFPLYEQLYGGATSDNLGAVVAGGQLSGKMTGDLVTLAPNVMTGSENAGAVYVLFGRPLQ